MLRPSFRISEGLLGATIVAGVLVGGIVAAVNFASNNTIIPLRSFFDKEKYPATAFVIKRQGPLKSKTTYTGIAGGTGMSVDVKFDSSAQKLMMKIKDRAGKPMPRITFDARVSKAGKLLSPRRFAIKEYTDGEYRSEAMNLEKGGWVLSVTAYDLFGRGDNKLLFHTEKPVFLK